MLSLPLLGATWVDAAVFGVSAAVILAGAFGVVFAANPVHSALMLVMTLFGVAVLFVAQEAHFLAAVQVIVYAGAIVVLFLFVIMLLGVDRREDVAEEPLRFQRPAAFGLGALVLLMILLMARSEGWVTGTPATGMDRLAEGENIELLGRSIFTTHVLAFEVTGVLLVIAVVGAVVLARKPPRAIAAEQQAEAEAEAAAAEEPQP